MLEMRGLLRFMIGMWASLRAGENDHDMTDLIDLS